MQSLKIGFKVSRGLLVLAMLVLPMFGFLRVHAEPNNTDPVLQHCIDAVHSKTDARQVCDSQLIQWARNAAILGPCKDKNVNNGDMDTCAQNHAEGFIDDAISAANKKSKNYSAAEFKDALVARLDQTHTDYKNNDAASKVGGAETVAPVCVSNNCADPAIGGCTSNDSRCDFIGKYINPAINLFSISFGIIAVISIVLGGIQYSAAGGDPQKVTMAKQRISKTLIAVIAYFFLYAFLEFIVPGGIFH